MLLLRRGGQRNPRKNAPRLAGDAKGCERRGVSRQAYRSSKLLLRYQRSEGRTFDRAEKKSILEGGRLIRKRSGAAKKKRGSTKS